MRGPARSPFVPLAALVVLCMGCGKDDDTPPVNGGTPWLDHIELSVDSACVQAPNVFTPNHDGMNDHFVVVTKNIVAVQITLFSSDGQLLRTTQDVQDTWTMLGAEEVGNTYRVLVQAVTTSGQTLTGQSYLRLLDYSPGNCIHFTGTAVTADQFDPRICGIAYPTNDIFCP